MERLASCYGSSSGSFLEAKVGCVMVKTFILVLLDKTRGHLDVKKGTRWIKDRECH